MHNINKLIHLVRKVQDDFGLITVRELAKKFRIKQSQVIELAEDADLCINIGEGTSFGTYEYEKIGDYTIEDSNYQPFE